MKTQSNKKQSILLIVFLVAIMALAAIFFTACMSDEEAFNKYGKENAFMKVSNTGAIMHVEGPVNFYLDPSLTGTYLSAVKYAIAKANAISSSVTVTGNGSTDSRFTITLKSKHPTENYYGIAAILRRSDGKVVRADIEIYKDAFYWCATSSLFKQVMMHEIGHVLGLDHCNSAVEGESLMDTYAGYIWGDADYGRFDKENIRWYYGD